MTFLCGRMNSSVARMCSSSSLTPGMSGVRTMNCVLGNASYAFLKFVADSLVARPGPLLVPFGIGQLDVVLHEIDVRQHLFHVLPGHVPGGFNRRVDAAPVGLDEQRLEEIGLQQALAAAHGHPTAGFPIERAVLLDLRQHLVHGHFLTEEVERVGRADRHALAAVGAQVPVDPHLVVGPFAGPDDVDRQFRTHRQAEPALFLADALARVVGELGQLEDALRVRAPLAAQRASLEEHGRADARAVVGTEVLNVQHAALSERWERWARQPCVTPPGRCRGTGRPGATRSGRARFGPC